MISPMDIYVHGLMGQNFLVMILKGEVYSF